MYHLSWWVYQSTYSGAWSWGDAKTLKYIVKVRVLSTNLVVTATKFIVLTVHATVLLSTS
jgi:hypothetical protein